MLGKCAWLRYWKVFLICKYLLSEPVSLLMVRIVRAQPTCFSIPISTMSSNRSFRENSMDCFCLTNNTKSSNATSSCAQKMASLKCPQKNSWVIKIIASTLQTKRAIKSRVTTAFRTKELGSNMNTRKSTSERDWCLLCSQISLSSYRIWNRNMNQISQRKPRIWRWKTSKMTTLICPQWLRYQLTLLFS